MSEDGEESDTHVEARDRRYSCLIFVQSKTLNSLTLTTKPICIHVLLICGVSIILSLYFVRITAAIKESE